MHIPVGYTDPVAPFCDKDTIPIREIPYMWSFVGDSYKPDRQRVLGAFQDIKSSFLHEHKGFLGEDKLSAEGYWESLTKSVFCPCPIGNVSIESYRTFEGLEAGAIPLIIKHQARQPYNYYKLLLGDHPISAFENWEQARVFVEESNMDQIVSLAQQINEWYQQYKIKIQKDIQSILLSSFHVTSQSE